MAAVVRVAHEPPARHQSREDTAMTHAPDLRERPERENFSGYSPQRSLRAGFMGGGYGGSRLRRLLLVYVCTCADC
jgi:hypothetical protein